MPASSPSSSSDSAYGILSSEDDREIQRAKGKGKGGKDKGKGQEKGMQDKGKGQEKGAHDQGKGQESQGGKGGNKENIPSDSSD